MFPFDADSFDWDHFERFCAMWLAAGTTLPNLTMTGYEDASRLRVKNATRLGTSGEKQHGIDILVEMENSTTWVVQCKHVKTFSETNATKAIQKAKQEFGRLYNPAHYLVFVTGKVTKDATLVALQENSVTLWNAEQITTEVKLYTPPRQCRQLIRDCFGHDWAKAFFPVADDLLITGNEFFERWNSSGQSFHHNATLAGRARDLEKFVNFATRDSGKRALIITAPGGVGKTRLLREVAARAEEELTNRQICFINPNAVPDADLPVDSDLARYTIIHDDAHRMDLRREILAAASRKETKGLRLILATRPGAEVVLRQQLMNAGFAASEIAEQPLERLSQGDLHDLALSIMGAGHEETAARLASLSDGCALITLVGAELLRRGELRNLDLTSAEHFRNEVFIRFEGEELSRVGGGMPKAALKMLLRAIALLSPWPVDDPEKMKAMAEFLDLTRGQIEAACDSLESGGLLLRTSKGLRIIPDLFSDHLAYSACYDDNGRSTPFVRRFLDQFTKEEGSSVIINLAEAEWRAMQRHKGTANGILDPIWNEYLRTFSGSSFWERSKMIERWVPVAACQPERSLELAERAMEMETAPESTGYDLLDDHAQVLSALPPLVRPVAIWCGGHREHALDILWRMQLLRTDATSSEQRDPYVDFAKVADFGENFPDAPAGVLDWLEQLLAGPDASSVADKPCGLWTMALSPFFRKTIRRDFWKDWRTMVMRTIPISVAKTRHLRERALALIKELLLPRGSVAVINALPVLGSAYDPRSPHGALGSILEREWQSERSEILQVITELAQNFKHPLIHFTIRRLLAWPVVYGKDEKDRAACFEVIESMPDTFELRLSRITLSWSYDDSLNRYVGRDNQEWFTREETDWKELLRTTVGELITQHPTAASLRQYLQSWDAECFRHGLEPHWGEILASIARLNQVLAFDLLKNLLNDPVSSLSREAALLLQPESGLQTEEMDTVFHQALTSSSSIIVGSFIHKFRYSEWLQSDANIRRLLRLADSANPQVMNMLISMIHHPRVQSWTEPLVKKLLEQPMTDDLLRSLAIAVTYAMQYSSWKLDDSVIERLLDRLVDLPSVFEDPKDERFLGNLVEAQPRKILEFFKRRIAKMEAEPGLQNSSYTSVPYYNGPLLFGLENEPDFESVADSILNQFLTRSEEIRPPWGRLFTMAVAHSGEMVGKLLLQVLPKIQTTEDLLGVCSLVKFEQSRIVYHHLDLMEAILSKARQFGPKSFDRILWELVHSATPTTRGYTNGLLNTEYAYARTAAEETLRKAKGRPLLESLYQKIIEVEIADIERAQKLYNQDIADES